MHRTALRRARDVPLLTTPQPAAARDRRSCASTSRACSPSDVSLHGVFMDVLGMGVLITGESGVGKSELALELISPRPRPGGRRHRRDLRASRPDTLEGRCPAMLQGFPRGARPRRAQHPHDLRRDRHAGRKMQLQADRRTCERPQPTSVRRARRACRSTRRSQDILGVPMRARDDPGRRRPQPRRAARSRGAHRRSCSCAASTPHWSSSSARSDAGRD
ncbi:MAG: hypothetical protein MZV65_44065 [Chromatiales bacterium]|nr:hypothetical protein [Chromatiales bacterium]